MTNEELDQARIDEACRLVNDDKTKYLLGEIARLAREGWTPPVVVDPDLYEARFVAGLRNYRAGEEIALEGIKRGRALAAEAKPGMVWVKHDQSDTSPVPGLMVTVRFHNNQYDTGLSFMFGWWSVTHYAIITPPDDVA